MGYSAQHLSDDEWMELQVAYRLHGSSAGFWDTYQRILARAVQRTGRDSEAANALALAAERLGAVPEAKMLDG